MLQLGRLGGILCLGGSGVDGCLGRPVPGVEDSIQVLPHVLLPFSQVRYCCLAPQLPSLSFGELLFSA